MSSLAISSQHNCAGVPRVEMAGLVRSEKWPGFRSKTIQDATTCRSACAWRSPAGASAPGYLPRSNWERFESNGGDAEWRFIFVWHGPVANFVHELEIKNCELRAKTWPADCADLEQSPIMGCTDPGNSITANVDGSRPGQKWRLPGWENVP